MASASTTQVASSKEDGDKATTEEEKNTAEASQDGSYSKLEPDWTRYPSDPEVDGTKHFSDLEVVSPGLEVSPSHGHAEGIRSGNLQAFHPGVMGLGESQGPMATHPGIGKDAEGPIAVEQPVDGPESEPTKQQQTLLGLRKPYFWAVVAAVVLLVIGGVVGGAVGGTRHHTSSSTSTSGSGSSSSVGPGGSATTSSAGSAPTGAKTGIKFGSNLAATAWTVSDTRYQYRVYYQDDDNAIKESGYDSLTGSWQVATILNGSGVLPNTSIAVAASKQSAAGSDTVPINLYYLDNNLDIRVILSQNGTFDHAPTSGAGKPSNPDASGKLAAHFLGCELCPNTTVVAFSSRNVITLYNDTSAEVWEEASPFSIEGDDASVLDGSSVSLQPYSISGYADQLNLYYQRSDANLVLASWFSWEYQRDHNLDLSSTSGWQGNGNNAVVGSISPNSSIATLYFGNANGSPAHVQAVTSGWNGSAYTGLEVYDWTNNAWGSLVAPAVLQSVSGPTAVAAHFYQRVYAVSDGILRQFAVADDGITWTVIGNVPTL